jgi:hypothetical protein
VSGDRIAVLCDTSDAGWECQVIVGDDPGATRHGVSVTLHELATFAPGDADPADLVRRSFEFLLARESRESILRHFELSVIERYFPEYREVITRA